MKTDDVNRLIEQAQCKTHPDAPHGFDRNASHNADRYVCECESWEPVDAVNMSPDRVDETAKGGHMIDCTDEQLMEEVRRRGFVIRDAQIRVTLTEPFTEEQKMFAYKKKWVGLTDEEIYDYADKFLYDGGSNYGVLSFGKAIEAKLKEKNT
jgi:hypothetical protein